MSTTNRNSQSPQESPAVKGSRGIMNCRPCQVRKIKCDRALPACGVCHLYQRSCFYEGVPKKRGPKKESLSALIKRIDGLEELIRSEKTPTPPGTDIVTTDFNDPRLPRGSFGDQCGSASSEISHYSSLRGGNFDANSEISATINAEGLVDIYFSNSHGNPYEILDEALTRQKLKANQLAKSVLYGICAVATGFSEKPGRGPSSHVSAETYAAWSQREVDLNEISIESCEALLLVAAAFAAMGSGKKAYVVLSQAVGMIMALELHISSDKPDDTQNQPEGDARRRVFWTAYVLNVFVSTWVERPSLIDDALIKADVHESRQSSQSSWLQAEDPNTNPRSERRRLPIPPQEPGNGRERLLWMVQILSDANRYLLLSDGTTQAAYCQRHKILHDLDLWLSDTDLSPESPRQNSDQMSGSQHLVCRLSFHLVHCLIHRPLLPLRLSEPSGQGMIQHWVVEAVEAAFRHATAIIELISQARETKMQFPPFVGFCIFTAATIFNFGVYYAEQHNVQDIGAGLPAFASSPMAAGPFASSPELFTRCLHELTALGETFNSARLSRNRLGDLQTEHVALLNGTVAGYVPTQTNRFFQRYSPALRRKVQGFHVEDVVTSDGKGIHTRSSSSTSHSGRSRKDSDAKMIWETTPTSAGPPMSGGKVPFAPPRPTIGVPSSHQHPGHQRSFSDSLSLTQSYSYDAISPMSQRQLPVWPGFQDATPRQGPIHGPQVLDPSVQLTSPICPRDGGMAAASGNWGGVKDFSGGEPLSYEVLAGPTSQAYSPPEGLAGPFVPFQNFSVP
ncbi:putative transcriptional regulatory protein [Colletotrichum orbiculare MAFF 240422]|uniref:Transcriptional regulatory protein n=1 Tax=Colletotrichum orbiculare (strain 104-T / ATCC 96160 / CBS 514.97 / LARS 414 / MAFF 240422) TaxID=1213857 RepID=N4VAF2_COLOR|nr:putative transcriptional regulatory protein [Colletotrichum orbiculare MAFF 240422]